MNSTNQVLQPGTLKRLLETHPFFTDWDNDQYQRVAGHSHLLELTAGTRLRSLGEVSPFTSFLLQGELELTVERRGRVRRVRVKLLPERPAAATSAASKPAASSSSAIVSSVSRRCFGGPRGLSVV